jgi:hypothetical protein
MSDNEFTESAPSDHLPEPALFGPGGEETLNKELGAIFDQCEKAGEKEERVAMPPRASEDIDETMERAHEWSDLSKAEQKRQTGNYHADTSLKEEAEARGLTIEQLTAIKQTEAIEQGTKLGEKTLKEVTQYRGTFDPVKQYYAGQTPTEITRGYVQLEQTYRTDPVHASLLMAQNAGYDPVQIAHGILQAAGQIQPSTEDREAVGIVERFFKANPGAAQYRYELAGAMERGEYEGSEEALREAYRELSQKDAKHSKARRKARSMHAEFARAYDEVMARR